MFGGKKDEKPEPVESAAAPVASQKVNSHGDARTQIGPGTVIKGEVSINGEAIVHGTVEGSLTASGNVDVVQGGLVKANVIARPYASPAASREKLSRAARCSSSAARMSAATSTRRA